MWYAVYQLADGALHSLGTVLPEDGLPAGLAAMEVGAERPDLATLVWDPATLSLVARATLPPDPMQPIDAVDFRERFTFQERVLVKQAATSSPAVAVLMEDVGARSTIRLGDPRTVAGVNLLRDVGCLTPERAAQILDPAWAPEAP